MAMAVFKAPLKGEFNGVRKIEGKQYKHHLLQQQSSGRRRVFVQTETGCVLGVELDRNDNVHTVKKRLQVAFNLPTEESSLTFGDMVLKNDLSAVRNDSPLLLKRNLMHRSSSTPCLSPTGNDLQRKDLSGPIEILSHSYCFLSLKQTANEIVMAMKMGVEPIPVNGGLGGAYYFRNEKGQSVAIVKPTDEEPFAPNNPKGFTGKTLGQPGLKPSVRVGETGYREVAAYLLDYDHFANVPPTALVKITHSVFNVNDGMDRNKSREKKKLVSSKIASFQKFVPHDFDASDHGTSSFPVSSVHRIGILDIRILNTDRHGGNFLVKKLDDGAAGRFGQVELFPIDHGLCLPETLEDPYFEWIHWPQASIPFSEEELDYIHNLDPVKDCEMLRRELPMIREACLRVLVLCTVFLKEAAAFGLCLAEIGEMMTREFRAGEEEPSELEMVCIEAKSLTVRQDVLSPKSDLEADTVFEFDLDCNDMDMVYSDELLVKNPFSSGHSSLGKLEESIVEEEEDEEEARLTLSLTKLSTSLKNHCLSNNMGSGFLKPPRVKTEKTLVSHKSANVQLPASANFVKLAEMKEAEWVMFLEKFQELLDSAFAERKTMTLRNRQRLGTSCKF
ncbi:PREDICTED: phosphatidylinositol 4-kinase gamma 6 [Camelina sativa]|uniref:1-phosphatidylinositol 4-kinase n=1 Tax=Camelina sativa TaxID=90675 RepID=A0ABM0VNF8_CAMSA|nr:PREDICTED: phosphatidylinositol 4-kinase gamma 6 [Camelina sativa]XP_010458818.1 PREDICTED: phosphatidylinositol 4-kinase gamma 6 [Camelina sativa]